jgi:hypothetical protein
MAVAQGMGYATRANFRDGGGAYDAPSTMWLAGGFDVHVGGRLGVEQDRLFQISAQDAKTGPISVGLQWFRHDTDVRAHPEELPGWKKPNETFDNPMRASTFGASIGGGGVHHLFSGAMGVRYHTRRAPVSGDKSELNVVASVGVIVVDQLILTLTGDNLIPQDEIEGAPLGIGTGTRWQPIEAFGIEFDTFTDFESRSDKVVITPNFGLEYIIAEVVPVRTGFYRDGVEEQSYVTAGFGVANEIVGLNYGGRLSVSQRAPGEKLGHWHGLELRASF